MAAYSPGTPSNPERPAFSQSKRRQADRASLAAGLLDWVAQRPVRLAPELDALIRDGFGAEAAGEDQFNAVTGLFGMLDVVLGLRGACRTCPMCEREKAGSSGRAAEGGPPWTRSALYGTGEQVFTKHSDASARPSPAPFCRGQ